MNHVCWVNGVGLEELCLMGKWSGVGITMLMGKWGWTNHVWDYKIVQNNIVMT
jgi:hypothetical protein